MQDITIQIHQIVDGAIRASDSGRIPVTSAMMTPILHERGLVYGVVDLGAALRALITSRKTMGIMPVLDQIQTQIEARLSPESVAGINRDIQDEVVS